MRTSRALRCVVSIVLVAAVGCSSKSSQTKGDAGVDMAHVATQDLAVRDEGVPDLARRRDLAPEDLSLADLLMPDLAMAHSYWVDPANGADTNPGNELGPFKTLGKATSVAVDGDLINLFDGTYDCATNQMFNSTCTAQIGDGVSVQAVDTHNAIFTDYAFHFVGSGSLSGVALGSTNGSQITAASGAVSLDDLLFNANAAITPLALSGTATVTLAGGHGAGYLAGARYFAILHDSSALTVSGGIFDSPAQTQDGDVLVDARDDTTVTLSTVTMKNGPRSAIALSDSAHVVLENGSTVHAFNSTSGTINGAIYVQGTGTPTLEVLHSTIENGASAILLGGATGAVNVVLNLDGATLQNNSAFGVATGGLGALNLTIKDASMVTGNAQGGVVLASSTATKATVTATVNGSTFTGNGGVALGINGNSSTIDLGSATTSGGNTFVVGGGGTTAVSITFPTSGTATIVTARGNTWSPGVQSADGSGNYTNGTSAPSGASGTNFILTNAQLAF